MIRNLVFLLALMSMFSCKRAPTNHDSGRTEMQSKSSRPEVRDEERNAVKMFQDGGVYFIPIEINDIGMDIIFDTGASSISISETEVYFLIKQGKITEDDFLGTVRFQDATGNISEGTRINLKKVKIGTKTIYDVEASVVHNLGAPLLLGQSALSKFGKLTIDYKKNEIVFE